MQEGTYLQSQNYLVTESLNLQIKSDRMTIKVQITIAIILIK